MSKKREYHAFYSPKMAAQYGVVIYENANGELVECCAVYRSQKEGEGVFKWDDRVYLGQVTHFVETHWKK